MNYLAIADVDWEILKVGDLVLEPVSGTHGKITDLYEGPDGSKFVTVMWNFQAIGMPSASGATAEHSLWDKQLWMGLGLDFTEDADSLSIKRNDHDEFLSD